VSVMGCSFQARPAWDANLDVLFADAVDDLLQVDDSPQRIRWVRRE
jgi:hypothetical protein